MNLKAQVTRDIADLVPQFLRSRRVEVHSLRAALAVQDGERLRELGQRMYAVGNPYGFTEVSTIGRQIMAASATGDFAAVGDLVAQYEEYLAKVEIVQIERPAPIAIAH